MQPYTHVETTMHTVGTLTLGHMHYHLTDLPPQPSVRGLDLRKIRRTKEASLPCIVKGELQQQAGRRVRPRELAAPLLREGVRRLGALDERLAPPARQ